MIKTTCTLLAVLAVATINGQTVTPVVVANDGGFSQTAAGSVAWTIGEPVSETYKQTTRITTMGFHQTELAVVDFISELEGEEGLVVFPNPVVDVLNLNFKGLKPGTYSITMVDAAGRLVLSEIAVVNENNEKVTLKVSEFASGNYYLNIAGESTGRTIKVTKVTQ